MARAGAYLAARRLLGEGEAVCACPEAGISYSCTVRSLMPGTVALARETGVPVVSTLWGSQRIWSVGRPVDGRGPASRRRGTPAHLGGDAPDRREVAELDQVPRSAVAPTRGPLLAPDRRVEMP